VPDLVEEHVERELARGEDGLLAAIMDFQRPVQIRLVGGVNEFHKLATHGTPKRK